MTANNADDGVAQHRPLSQRHMLYWHWRVVVLRPICVFGVHLPKSAFHAF